MSRLTLARAALESFTDMRGSTDFAGAVLRRFPQGYKSDSETPPLPTASIALPRGRAPSQPRLIRQASLTDSQPLLVEAVDARFLWRQEYALPRLIGRLAAE